MEHSKQLELAELLKSVQTLPNLPQEAVPLLSAMAGIIHSNLPYFNVARLHRDDLVSKGFITKNTPNEVLERLASKLGDDYCEQLFWSSLDIIADIMEIPKVTTALDRLVGLCKDATSESIPNDEKTICDQFIEFIGDAVELSEVQEMVKLYQPKFLSLLGGVKQIIQKYNSPNCMQEYLNLVEDVEWYINQNINE